MVSLPRYENYKDSGVEWLGEIPEHWELSSGRTCFVQQEVKNKGNLEKTVLSLSYGRIVIKPEEKLTGLVPESFETYQIVDDGNIIIRSTDLQNDKTSLRIGLVKNKGIITSAYLCLATKNKISHNFAYYLLHAYDLQKIYYGMGSGLRQNLSFTDFKYLPIPLPKISEQKRIAEFLDRKCGEIDEAIAKKQRLIELLEEQKTILINQAVTKGLNPDAPMKDSGIEWLGEIPEHWETRKIKYICKLETGHTPRRTNDTFWKEEECIIPWVSLNDTKTIKKVDYLSETKYKISLKGMANSSAHLIQKGAVIFTRDATIGLAAILDKPMAVSQHIIAWVCSEKIYNCYLLNVIYTMTSELERLTMGSTLKTIGMPDVKSLQTPVPPMNEQLTIIDFIEQNNNRFENLSKKNHEQIKNLIELKQILIAEAVTGKIKV